MKPYLKPEGETAEMATQWIMRKHRGLSPAEEKELSRWLEDPEHGRAYARHAATWEMFGRLEAKGKLGVLEEKVRRLARRKRIRRRVTGTVVALLVAAAATWRLTLPRVAETETGRTVVILPKHEVLADGSVVDAPGGTKYVVDFAGPLRRVRLLSGLALFTVAHDTKRPFVVDAGEVEARAVGTAFSVQLDRAKVSVLVTEGKVAIDPSAGAANAPAEGLGLGKLAMVQAGHQAVVDRLAMPATVPVAPMTEQEIAEKLAWRNPRVEFSGVPLGEVVATINRYSVVQFVVDDPVLEKRELSGVFPADNSEAIEQMLVTGFGVAAEHRGAQVILRRAVR